MRRTLRLAIWLLTLAYPWLWYYGGGARALAGVMAVAWLLRALIADSATIRAGAVALAAFFLLAALRKIGVDIVNIVAGRDDPAPRSELQRIGALRREASRADILGLFPHEFVSSIQK